MADFDRERFDALMLEGQRLHGDGEHNEALSRRLAAHDIAPEGTLEKGRAARDTAASYDKLGKLGDMGRYALDAYEQHHAFMRGLDEPTREAHRELAASAVYFDNYLIRGAIQSGNRVPTDVSWYARRAWDNLQSAGRLAPQWIDGAFDQYKINSARRISIAEALDGSRWRALMIGATAVALSAMSESPRIDTSNKDLSPYERRRAKRRAFLGGLAAVGVGFVVSSRHRSPRRQLALRIAEHAL